MTRLPARESTHVDVLATPDQRRNIWATIAGMIATDLRDREGFEEGARMALDFALMPDPPRDWPDGSFGDRMRRGDA